MMIPRGARSFLSVFIPCLIAFAWLTCGCTRSSNDPQPRTAPFASADGPGPLRVLSGNPRWFTDNSGKGIYLACAHTWSTFQDNGPTDPPPVFDYQEWLRQATDLGYNCLKLWSFEQARWSVEHAGEEYYYAPSLYLRTDDASSLALDGKPKFDLDQLNPLYFDRLRQRVLAAQRHGLYAIVMLFQGWSVERPKGPIDWNNPWRGHPFNISNNIQRINGDRNGNGSGEEVHMLNSGKVLGYQEAYVRKAIDTLNDLDNVLWEISNESHSRSTAWQEHMIEVIRAHERTKPKQHLIGFTVPVPDGANADIFSSRADWVSPRDDGFHTYMTDPPSNRTSKVILSDTDHLFGIGGNRAWVWKSFTRGLHTLYMDCHPSYLPGGVGSGGWDPNCLNPDFASLRQNLGFARRFADRLPLAQMIPQEDLCSSRYCLAHVNRTEAAILVYQPSRGTITVDLSALSPAAEVRVEWFNPENGQTQAGKNVAGGRSIDFVQPFGNDIVLCLRTP